MTYKGRLSFRKNSEGFADQRQLLYHRSHKRRRADSVHNLAGCGKKAVCERAHLITKTFSELESVAGETHVAVES